MRLQRAIDVAETRAGTNGDRITSDGYRTHRADVDDDAA